jgi:type I restriction enzyme S subunit
MVKAGYKQTEIGEIPDDWDAVALDGYVEITSGESPSKFKFSSSGVPYFKVDQLNGGNKYIADTPYFIGTKKVSIAGSVIFPKRGASILLNKIRILSHDSFMDTNLMALTVRNGLSNEFLFYSLDYQGLSSVADTTSIPQINNKHIKPFIIRLPAPEEQKAIADALSDVDALIGSLEKLIAKKRDIKTATMQQLLTGEKRLPGFQEKWSSLSIGEHAYLKARIGWQALTTNEYREFGDHRLVTGTDFKNGRIDWSACWYVDVWRYSQDRNIQLSQDDVLITKDGTIGKVGYVDELKVPATLNSGVFVIRPIKNSFYPKFLYYILSSTIFDEFLDEITAGSTITHLYQKDFVNFEFKAPEHKEQQEIARILSSMDLEINELHQQLSKTKAIKQGMMQELLTGRTRLV